MALLKEREKVSDEISKLLRRVDKPLPLLSAKEKESNRILAEDSKVHNTYGSSAGAGSGEFHVYRHLKRREQERLAAMEAAEQQKKELESLKLAQAQRTQKAQEKTLKNRAKRLKKKARHRDTFQQIAASGTDKVETVNKDVNVNNPTRVTEKVQNSCLKGDTGQPDKPAKKQRLGLLTIVDEG